MFFFRKKEPRKKAFYEDSDQVFLYWGAYYRMKKDAETACTFTVIPGDEVDTAEFLELAFACMEKLFADKPVVLNNLTAASALAQLWEEPCVQAYIAQGGTPEFPTNHQLFTVSRGMDKLLADGIPRDIYGCFYLTIYGYGPGEAMRYDRCLTAHYNEDHQYLEVTAPKDMERCVEIVREICGRHGKGLCMIDPITKEAP